MLVFCSYIKNKILNEHNYIHITQSRIVIVIINIRGEVMARKVVGSKGSA